MIEFENRGRMSIDYLDPVCQTPRGYRVSGLLKIIMCARKPAGQINVRRIYSIKHTRSESSDGNLKKNAVIKTTAVDVKNCL
jgi:hypothetical protein